MPDPEPPYISLPPTPPSVSTNFIAASIQFECDPDELATKIGTQLVHESKSKTYV
jgi:hypothetical protein